MKLILRLVPHALYAWWERDGRRESYACTRPLSPCWWCAWLICVAGMAVFCTARPRLAHARKRGILYEEQAGGGRWFSELRDEGGFCV